MPIPLHTALASQAAESAVLGLRPRLHAAPMGDAAAPQALARLTETTRCSVKNRAAARWLAGAIKAIRSRDFQRAQTLALKALGRDEQLGLAWHVLAIAREKAGDLGAALRCYEAALKLDAQAEAVAGDLGRLAFRLGMPETAAKLFAHYLQAKPGDTEGVNNLACALRDLNRCEDAISVLRPVLLERPGEALLWNTLGTVLCSQGDAAGAVIFFDEALRLAPGFGKALHNRAYARIDLGDVEGALSDCEAALVDAATAEDRATMAFARSTALLALGQLSDGWRAYEARLDEDLPDAPRFRLPGRRLDPGEDLAGKTLLICAEQGLGDEVMFANVLPSALAALGDGKATVAVERRLVDLFARSFPSARVVAHRTVAFEGRVYRSAPEVEEAAFDAWTPMASLLGDFRPTAADFSKATAYLTADPDRVSRWRGLLDALGPQPKIGLLWKSLKLDGDRARQFSPFALWEPVLRTPGVDFVNLQYGDCETELALARDQFGVEIWVPPGVDLKNELDEVTALCKAVDLVIGFSNATINLAGACGAPVWLITASGAWTRLGTAHYPWYPTARTFATSDYSDWSQVMGQIAAALSQHVGAGREPASW